MTREAELELEIARLREALRKSAYMVRENCITPGGNPFALQEIERLAAAKPSTTALQDLINEVERRTIERCAEYLDETDSQYYDGYEFRTLTPSDLGECLRALPTGNLKLEDLT